MNRQRAIVLVLLLILFARLTLDARKLSFTSDEPSHIASGYAYLAERATWTIPLRGHPLLVDAWLALPVYLGNPSIPLTTLPGWEEDNTQYVHSFVSHLTSHVEQAEVASRTPVMLLTVLLAAVVARWACDVAGQRGSLMALIVLTCDPILLGHGMLATNDIGVTALGTLGLFLTHRLSRRDAAGGHRLAVATGIALGATLLAKGSGVIWLAGAAGMLTAEVLRKGIDWRSLAKAGQLMAEVTSVALLCVWAFYGFEMSPLPAFGVQFPMPAATHWTSVLAQSEWADIRDTYFLGTLRVSGDWRYFPIAALIKNPLPLLGLVFLALLTSLRKHREGTHHSSALLWIFPLLYAGIAVYSKINIGYRHMIPVHPFLYLLIATLATQRATVRTVSMALIVWLIIDSVLTAPNYIAYFNQITGGPPGGWRYLGDSNTDWAQGFKALRAYQARRKEPFRFSGPTGYIGPEVYGLQFTPLAPVPGSLTPVFEPRLQPMPGTYVISANSLIGLECVDSDNYAWFRYHQPDTIIADALFVYHVASIEDATWLAQCTVPAVPLTEAAIARGFAQPPNRVLAFDCTQTWVYPGGGQSPGWYTLHDQALSPQMKLWQRLLLSPPIPSHPFVARRLEHMPVAFRQWEYHDLPAFILYEVHSDYEIASPPAKTVFPAPAEATPVQLGAGVMTPVAFEGPLEFLGITAYNHRDSLEIETWWRVTTRPDGRPFSIMAHLLDAGGQALAVADGLGVAPTELQRGDVVVQSHVFLSDGTDGARWLRTGAYWLDTGVRWSVGDDSEDAIFVPLQIP